MYKEHLYMNDDGLWQRLWMIAETLSIFLVLVLVFLDISVKLLLKQPLHNHTNLFIKAMQNPGPLWTYKLGGAKPPPPPVDSPLSNQVVYVYCVSKAVGQTYQK
jgi:hypothetical protein